ncbi:hypothetical protein ACJW30_11G098600 [Castanea mollissima]
MVCAQCTSMMIGYGKPCGHHSKRFQRSLRTKCIQAIDCQWSSTCGFLLGRTLAVLITMTLGTSMAARQGPVAMAAHQICIRVWLAVSLLTDALAASGQVWISLLEGVVSCPTILMFLENGLSVASLT